MLCKYFWLLSRFVQIMYLCIYSYFHRVSIYTELLVKRQYAISGL